MLPQEFIVSDSLSANCLIKDWQDHLEVTEGESGKHIVFEREKVKNGLKLEITADSNMQLPTLIPLTVTQKRRGTEYTYTHSDFVNKNILPTETKTVGNICTLYYPECKAGHYLFARKTGEKWCATWVEIK